MFGVVKDILTHITETLNVLVSGESGSSSTSSPEAPPDAPLARDGNWKFVMHTDNTRESIIEMKDCVLITHKFRYR
jgi:hypothetical protein